jgi:hypothetical protein
MDVLVNVVHPIGRDEMVFPAGLGVRLCELDLVGTFQVIHGSDMLTVGSQDFHVFLDIALIEHGYASVSCIRSTERTGRKFQKKNRA